MSFEFFNPGEGGESYDPAAFERFKQQVKKNAAFVAALRKGEQKQKQKEDRLAQLLLKFIQSNQRSSVVMLAARLLEENIPASFILSIIILGNEDELAQAGREAGVGIEQLKAGESAAKPQTELLRQARGTSDFSLIATFADSTLPLKLKIAIDEWGKGIIEAGSGAPFRVLETALDKQGEVKRIVIDCAANILGDFIEMSGGPTVAYDTCFSFCEFLMKGVMQRLQKQIENQKELL